MKKIILVCAVIAATSTWHAVALSPGCGSNSSITTVATDVIDCAKAEATAIANGFSVGAAYTAVIGAIEGVITGGVAALWTTIEGLIVKYGGDLIACAIDDYPSGSGSGSASATPPIDAGSSSPVAPAPAVAVVEPSPADKLAIKQSLLAKYFPGKKIQHKHK